MADLRLTGAFPDFAVRADWPVRRLWDVAELRSIKNRPDLPLLSVFLGRGVIPYGDGGGQVHKPGQDLSVYQVVNPGDLVLNNQQAWRGSVGVSRYHGIISPAYVVLALRGSLNPRFSSYLFQSRALVSQFVTASKGVGDIQRDVHLPWLKNTRVPLPTAAEQAAIARYLDWANRRQERAIRAKRRVISLLDEQKQAVIHRAVTRGLDASVPLKASGVPWLGDIPQHWEVQRAKYLYREVDERSKAGNEELLSVSHLTGVTPRSQKSVTMFRAASYAGHKLCRPGDLVVNTMWAWMGALGVSTHAGIVSPAYAVYRPRRAEGIIGMYMDGLLRSRPYVSNILCRSTGLRASRLRLYPEEFFRLPIVQPPADEQRRIVEKIREETAELQIAISRLDREVELLREYRARLIADVVTGKLDVREAAARLPDDYDTVDDGADQSLDPESADEEGVA